MSPIPVWVSVIQVAVPSATLRKRRHGAGTRAGLWRPSGLRRF